MWMDRSKLNQENAEAAVCWRNKNLDQRKEKSGFLRKNKEILAAELWAILKALEIASKETLHSKSTPVTIFCNLQKALQAI